MNTFQVCEILRIEKSFAIIFEKTCAFSRLPGVCENKYCANILMILHILGMLQKLGTPIAYVLMQMQTTNNKQVEGERIMSKRMNEMLRSGKSETRIEMIRFEDATIDDLRAERDAASRRGDKDYALKLAIAIDRKRGFYK
jgi:hypothetical protein